MGPPHFPITPDQLRGQWSFAGLDEGVHQIGGFSSMVDHAVGAASCT